MKSFSPGQQRVLLSFTLLILGVSALRFYPEPSRPSPDSGKPEVVIEISGEVRHPGIYGFQYAPSLRDLVERAGGIAGGLTHDFDDAETVFETGTSVRITNGASRLIKVQAGPMEAHKRLLFFIPIDLNRAGVEELCLLPGVGEAVAAEIIAYRNRRKGFSSVDELKKIKGLGEKRFPFIKPYVTVVRLSSLPEEEQEEEKAE